MWFDFLQLSVKLCYALSNCNLIFCKCFRNSRIPWECLELCGHFSQPDVKLLFPNGYALKIMPCSLQLELFRHVLENIKSESQVCLGRPKSQILHSVSIIILSKESFPKSDECFNTPLITDFYNFCPRYIKHSNH